MTAINHRIWFRGYLTGLATAAVLGAVFVLLTGCASVDGLTAATYEHALDSGFQRGAGLRTEIVGPATGTIRPRLDAKLAWQPKIHADSGYTYSVLGGLSAGREFFGEIGYVWYGYESRFPPDRYGGGTWRSDQSSPYVRAGWRPGDDLAGWLVGLTYYPPTSDSYDSDELKLEVRAAIGKRFVLIAEPSLYRFEVLGVDTRGTSLTVGAGARW